MILYSLQYVVWRLFWCTCKPMLAYVNFMSILLLLVCNFYLFIQCHLSVESSIHSSPIMAMNRNLLSYKNFEVELLFFFFLLFWKELKSFLSLLESTLWLWTIPSCIHYINAKFSTHYPLLDVTCWPSDRISIKTSQHIID